MGYNSVSNVGRPATRRLTTDLWSIDAVDLAKRGVFTAGQRLTFSYEYGAFTVNAILVTTSRPCHFGGQRIWFVCGACGELRQKLYAGRALACRKCLNLAYPSQRRDAGGRSWDRQRKIEARLMQLAANHDEWVRPLGMRLVKYERLVREVREIETLREALLMREFSQLLE